MVKAMINTAAGGASRRGMARWSGFLYVLPAVVLISVFFLLPLGMTAWMSFHDWPLIGKSVFVGVQNYLNLAQDGQFWRTIGFTTRYTLIVVPILFALGFGLALLVRPRWRFVGAFRSSYFVPSVVGMGTASLLFIWLFNDQVGLFQWIPMWLGLWQEPMVWQIELGTAMAAVVGMVVWKSVGGTMIFLLIGMQAIPEELYEAATVDGAGPWQKLRFVTVPLMRRTFALALVLSVVGSYLAFDQFYIMTGGGPDNQTISAVYLIYNTGFNYYKLGYAASLSIVLLLLLSVFSVLQLRLLRDDARL